MKLLQAQRLARLGYWERDLKTNKVYWSDEVYRIFGLRPMPFGETFETFLACIHPEDRESVIQSANTLLKDPQGKIDVEYRVLRPDDSQRVVVERGEMILGASGSQSYLIGTMLDITEHREMENGLRKTRDELEIRVRERTKELERQASLLELAHDAIIVRDMDDKVTFWNKGAEAMYGWKKDEAMGSVIHEFLKTKFPVSFDDTIAALMQHG